MSASVDTVAPVAMNASVTVDGMPRTRLLVAGETAELRVDLDDNVVLSPDAAVSLQLSNGRVLSGGLSANQDALIFTYVVGGDEGTSNLQVVSLAVQGGTLRDLAGNDVDFSGALGTLELAVDTPTSGQPAVTGTAQRGATLTAEVGSLTDNDGLVSVSYRWQRDDGMGGWTNIAGSAGSNYTLVSDDVGHAVRAVATFVNSLGISGEKEALGSAVVTAPAEQPPIVELPPVAQPPVTQPPVMQPPIEVVIPALFEQPRTVLFSDIKALLGTPQASSLASILIASGTEEVRLADGVLSFGPTTHASFLTRLYGGVLGRQGDGHGLSGWSKSLETNADRVRVADGFLNSDEYRVRHGMLDDVQFIRSLYNEVLFRDAEDGATDYWTDLLSNGATRAQILAAIADSAEARDAWSATTSAGVFVPDEAAGLVRATYRAAFGRDAEAPGLAFHVDRFAAGAKVEAFGNTVEGSDEFVRLHGNQSNAEYVQSLFGNALGRGAEDVELSYYEERLASGAEDRSDVLLDVVFSPEAREHLGWAL